MYKSYKLKDVFGVNTRLEVTSYADSTIPGIPQTDDSYVIRKDLLREVVAFLRDPDGDALYVSGPTGSGKTSGITEILGRLNWPVQQITANGRMEVQDLIGYHALIADKPGDTPSMRFMYGPLAIAAREGHVLLINEIDLVDPAEVSALNDILEGRPLVIAQNGGEVIKPHPMFRVIVTGNTTGNGDDSGSFVGTLMQNMAAMDRYRFSIVDYCDEKTENEILAKAVPSLPEDHRNLMIRVANDIRKVFVGGDDQSSGESSPTISLTMSTRVLRRWAKLAVDFRGAPNAFAYALEHALLARAKPVDREVVLRIAKDTFGKAWK